ncbi:glycosyltransferase family 2 protein [Mammaliicoccus lentus]|jgi:glycosyltransferase involved in cell wall biosynthesis|uniref:glycosyltransferase family 2 protein n=1 Tax=Mammaliicoccus lentus TaxID=42858 RepID=UPI003512B107
MFSVIISTYNGGKNLVNTIENIKHGLKNFKSEIIIINDGSTDNTEKTLNKYKKDKQFKIINQENKGISASRNVGLDNLNLNTDFVVFVDDSDTVQSNYFDKIKRFFVLNNDIDIVAVPLIRTNKEKRKHHSLNYRFHSKVEIVNIHKNHNFIHFHIGGIAFRYEILKNKNYRFDEKITYWEDAKFINTLLLDKQKYGLIKNTAYFYNSEDPNSLSKSAWALQERYTPLIQNNYMYLIKKSNQNFGKTIKYVQYLISTHYIEYLKRHNQEKIVNSSHFDKNRFKEMSKILFKNIDSNIIYELNCEYYIKNYLLNLKKESLNINKLIDEFGVYLHSYNPFSGKISFTFSKQTCAIPKESKVYLEYFNKKTKPVKFVKKKNAYILGELINDFSKNIYEIKLPIAATFMETNMLIVSKNNSYVVRNPSIINRLMKKVFCMKKRSI